jgi:hypothetical protein
VKDHKKNDNKWGQFPTRLLVIPANKITRVFPKLGHLGIKKIFEEAKIDCMTKRASRLLTPRMSWEA